MNGEKEIINLAEDTDSAAESDDVEYVGVSVSRVQSSRRRASTNSDVLIIEDEEPDEPPVPQVACHFFFPAEENVAEDRVEEAISDPLAPVPEWVDCSTLNSEQEPMEDEIEAPNGLALTNVMSLAYNDPLLSAGHIKTEPQEEADIKPSLQELSEMVPARLPLEKYGCGERQKILPEEQIKKECVSNDTPSNKILVQRNPHDSVSIPIDKLINKVKIGPKSAMFRKEEKEVENKNKNEHTIQNKNSEPKLESRAKIDLKYLNENKTVAQENKNLKQKLEQRVKIGPKCAKFRQQVEKIETQNIVQEDTSLKTTPSNRTQPRKKVGPKCAKFRQQVEKMENPNKIENIFQEDKSLKTTHSNRTQLSTKVGPKCTKFRQQVEKMKNPNKTENIVQEDKSLKTTPSNRTQLWTRLPGPKCAKFRQTTEPHMKDQIEKNLLKDTGKDIFSSIRPAIVSIGPRLPLPQCFQKNQELSLDSLQEGGEDRKDDTMDKDHIVLKIYTCFKCNHKCTDPLFHEEHLNYCATKRHSKSLNFSLQPCKKINGFYRCGICLFKFQNRENLCNHLNLHEVKGFICHICQLNFLTLNELSQHTVSAHKHLEKVFSCNICDYSSQELHYIKEHITRHNNDYHLYCPSCRMNCEDTEAIEQHRREFHKRHSMKNGGTKENKQAENKSVANSLRSKKSALTSSEEEEETNQATIPCDARIVLHETHSSTNSSDTIETKTAIKKFEEQIIQKDGKYCCNGCDYTFIHLKNLQIHKKYHLQHKPFSCCNNLFVSFSYLDYCAHMRKTHGKSLLKCSTCAFTSVSPCNLGRHMVKHVKDDLYCFACKVNSEDFSAFELHLSKGHRHNFSRAKYSCNECSFATHFKLVLKRHVQRHYRDRKHSNANQKYDKSGIEQEEVNSVERKKVERSFRTSVDSGVDQSCGKLKSDVNTDLTWEDTAALKEPVKNMHDHHQLAQRESDTSIRTEEFRCHKCNFKCAQSTDFVQHLRSSHPRRKFTCNVCKTGFRYLIHYLKHMQNHAACAVIYLCNECKFSSKKRLIFAKHMRSHTFKCCPLCDYKTKEFYRLKNHLENIHTNEKNEYPSHLNDDVQNLMNHRTSETEMNLSKTDDSTFINNSEIVHSCCFCSFKTNEIDSLRGHMAVHFTNDSGSSKNNEESNSKVSKPSLTLKGLKSKSLATKTAKNRPVERSIQVGVNGLIPLYCCTLCGDFKSKCRRSVAFHILKVHRRQGGVRNNTIRRILVKPSVTVKTNRPKTSQKPEQESNARPTGNNNKVLHVSNQSVSATDGPVQLEQIGALDAEVIMLKPKKSKSEQSTSNLAIKCKSCDLKKLSHPAQKQHLKFGHSGFWQKPFPCKICACRFKTKKSYEHHLKWKHAITKEAQEHIKTSCTPLSNSGNFLKQNSAGLRKYFPKVIVKCLQCNIETFPVAAQRQHLKNGHDVFWDKPFGCDICKMRSTNQGGLSRHKLVHTQFTSKKKEELDSKEEATLRKHSKLTKNTKVSKGGVNSDEEQYMCGECDFATASVIEFSTHMFIHTGIPDD
ncbi:zinc finger protein Xfin-like [Macrosteles quadrilineatus]|uniref:zinc finger protein Xfin-like n=1 Tax=Macrosteles quadrilineatus TaxID=74068 RepID=UPI0023E1A530|nr:zinc finger protein Xfin-like [Macrosteles quadrilineatus]